MASNKHKKNWVLTKGQDYEPNGSLSLGQILRDPWQPASALIPEGTIKIPENIKTESTKKYSVKVSFNDNLTKSFALWSELPNTAPVTAGAEASASITQSKSASFKIETLESKIFLPSLAYVTQALQSGDVPSKTQWWKARKRIYMVTGVRTAHGASIDAEESNERELHGKAEADATSQGVPLTAGAEIKDKTSSSKAEAAKAVSDFVFAYRLSEINYRLCISHKPFADGETADVESGNDAEVEVEGDDEGEAGYDGYELINVEESDFDGGWEIPFESYSLSTSDDTESFMLYRLAYQSRKKDGAT